jgi:hypothetical protein
VRIGSRRRCPDRSATRRQIATRVTMLVALASVVALPVAPASADVAYQQTSPDDPAQQLVERFAPIIMLKQQADECDSEGEPYGPSTVDIVLDNPEVALRQVGRDDIVVTRAPSAADLAGLGEGFYLDFPGSSLSPGCIYESDFRKYSGDRPATVYAHIVQQPDAPDRLVVQYWIYWYYNDWNNKHESDWEGISLLFEAASIEEALASAPVEVGYSQHEGGERADWDSDKLEREGDHPVVYSSAGSHASYYGSAIFLGRSASEGFGCDDTTGPSERVAPDVVLLPDSVDDPADPLAWLSFDGRWGERQNGAFNGPTGPALKDRWLEPLPWFDELRESGVVIPGGHSDGASVISAFCGIVEGGSRLLITATISPYFVAFAGLLVIVTLRFLIRRTDWSLVDAKPLRRRRRAGQIIRLSARSYREAPSMFVALGTLYIPAAVLAGLIAAVAQLLPVVGEFLALARPSGATNLFVAALAGSFVNLAAYVAVNAMVAEHQRGDENGMAGLSSAARRTWQRRGTLLGAFFRSYVTVVVLFATVIGIPWGIRQLVRYQFVPHTIVHEDADISGSLRRSSELVRGRWFHTLFVTATLNSIVFMAATGLSLLLLVLASGIPIWIFSGLVSLVYVFVTPLAAIAMNLLYGDAVAAHERAPRAELVSVD